MEVRECRCCMCPQRESSNRICPTGPGKTKETICDFVIVWTDSRGWKYKIMHSSTGGYKGYYQDHKHDGDNGWKSMRQMEKRESFDWAQEDLNQYAKKKGWNPIDNPISNLIDSKKSICDWIMGMQAKEYFDFMSMVLENTQIPVAGTITEEMFYSCS